MKKRHIVFLAAILVTIVVIVILSNSRTSEAIQIDTEVQQGKFDIIVTVTGELQARNSVKIEASFQVLREIEFWEISIAEIVPEGTVVDSGDFVARLDASNVENALREIETEIDNSLGEIEKARIDSSLELRAQRDNIINLRFSVQEAEITLEQSKYESPSVIRKAQIDLDKVKREYQQTLGNYKLKVQQAEVNIKQKNNDLNKKLRQKEKILEGLRSLLIRAPASGMVIYRKERDGTKVTTGSMIRIFRDPVVATLPDLTSFNSNTYVNEIDISKVKPGQPVGVGVDAFPEKKFTGRVFSVANVGEQLPNADAKLFEVIIHVNETDPVLRPSMTTSNLIYTRTFDDVVFIPLETVHTEDSLTFVYKKNKTKQMVLLDEANENEVIVKEGLSKGEKILLSVPEDVKDYKITGTELIPKIKEQIREREKKTQVQDRPDKRRERRELPPEGRSTDFNRDQTRAN
ncbi:MAG TPA: efflux RND transporter periplasmic adaptor subunit [Bacteroidales bacterium]|nr:efflux RND transporter periplasmic adaptor subunit [Bacteroidales bacterium]